MFASATALMLSIIGSGTATAATPSGWVPGYGTDSSAFPQPSSGASSPLVSAGHTVGFFEWLRNDGPSNISQLFVNETTSATVVGAQWTIEDSSGNTVSGPNLCPVATPLVCNIGALNDGQTVYLVAAFTVPASNADGSMSVNFNWNTTGIVLLKGKNQSHGDAVKWPDSVQVAGSNNGDAAGDFNIDQSSFTVADNQKITGKNPQATSATFAQVLTGASVGDSPSLTIPCDSTLLPDFDCSQLTSLVSAVEVGNGKTFNSTNGGPGIKVVVVFSQSPNQLGGSTPFVYHYYTDSSGTGHAELITERCNLDANNLPTNWDQYGCLTPGNKQVTVWLFHNGGLRM